MTLPFKNARTLAQLAFLIFIRPIFPFGQWLVFTLGLTNNPTNRQEYLLGNLKPGVAASQAKAHLKTQGFFMNRVAYFDPGQVLSMRRLDDELPARQYHIRIFEDGEIRGHYEYTPQDKPWRHLRGDIHEKREEYFMPWLKEIMV